MGEEYVTGSVKLKLFGEPVEMEMTVPANPVKVRKMLPIFQTMTNSFIEIGETQAIARGEQISCRKGCAACCRQVIPIPEIEAYHLRDLVENLPEPRRSEIKTRFTAGIERLAAKDWFERMKHYGTMSYQERVAIAMEYFQENIACPFLEDESCSIHPSRPLICREYLVTSPAENCGSSSALTVHTVKLPVEISFVMRQFNRYEKFIPMIAALEFASQVPEDETEKPGTEWMRDFFTYLMEQENSKTDSEST